MSFSVKAKEAALDTKIAEKVLKPYLFEDYEASPIYS